VEIWYVSGGPTTRRKERIMAKIVVRLPEPKREYSEDNQRQINRALSILIEQLNSTYLTQQKEDQERFTWLGLG
tara:strand:- start:209 stop:430 length:222 start_codon:yes stop_codon:yes gene_type:complete